MLKVQIEDPAGAAAPKAVKPPKRARLKRAIPRNPQGQTPIMAAVGASRQHPHDNLGNYLHKKKGA